MSGGGAPRLAGRCILVTRPKERAQQLCFLLEDEGARVLELPLFELKPPEDDRPLAAAAEQIHRYAWVALASPSAAQALAEAVRRAGTGRHLRRVRAAALGPRTASAARALGFEVGLESGEPTGAGLAKALAGSLSPGDQVLLPAAEEGREELLEGLSAAGAEVTRVAAYRSVPLERDEEAWAEACAAPVDAVLFGSPRTVEQFLEQGGERARALLGRAPWVAIGPTTAQAIRDLGVGEGAVAKAPTPEAWVEATVAALGG